MFSSIATPAHKTIWSAPAAINFFLGGTAAGYYLLFALFMRDSTLPAFTGASGGLVAALLILVGFASLALEAGRPLRAHYLSTNWKRSWMSREATAGIVFILAVAADTVAASSTARAVALAAAGVFLLSQAMMFHECTAVAAWRSPVLPVLFISSGIASGYGLILLNFQGVMLPRIQVSSGASIMALLCLAVNCASWLVLIRSNQNPDRKLVSKRLSKPVRVFVIVGIGQLLPFVLILGIRPWDTVIGATSISLGAALALLAGNWAQKSGLVRDTQQICGLKIGDS